MEKQPQQTVGERIVDIASRHPVYGSLNRAELAEALGVSYEALRLWCVGLKFPSKKNETKIAGLLGVRPETFMHGVDYLGVDAAGRVMVHESNVEADDGAGLARLVSRIPATVEAPAREPEINWRDQEMLAAHKRFVVVAPDDSMAPIVLEGARLVFDRSLEPRTKDIVLLTDAEGEWYIREFRRGPNKRWEAHASNGLPMDSERDGLQILAVCDGMQGRRG